MKKITKTKLALTTEVVRSLNGGEMVRVLGGVRNGGGATQTPTFACNVQSGTSVPTTLCAPSDQCSADCQMG